jgi:hypothetical protein
MKRAVSIVNFYRDSVSESIDHPWFMNTSNTTLRPTSKEWWLYDPMNWHRVSTGYKSVLGCLLKIKWLLFENIPLQENNGYMICYGGKIKKIQVDGNTKVRFVLNEENVDTIGNSHIENKRKSENQKKQILTFLKEKAERERRERIRRQAEIIESRRVEEITRRQEAHRQMQEARQRERDEQARRANMNETERLNNLPLVQEAIETTECPVCMEHLGNTNKVVLRCGHQFCGDCLFKHLQMPRGTNCPLCRAEFTLRPRGWLPPSASDSRNSSHRRDQNVTGRSEERERARLLRQNIETNLRLENLETILQQMANNHIRMNSS